MALPAYLFKLEVLFFREAEILFKRRHIKSSSHIIAETLGDGLDGRFAGADLLVRNSSFPYKYS